MVTLGSQIGNQRKLTGSDKKKKGAGKNKKSAEELRKMRMKPETF
jgi:hypothetical protein